MKVSIPDSLSYFALEFQQQCDRQGLCHFAMRRHPHFECLHDQVLHRNPLPSLTKAITEFTSEATHLQMISSIFPH